VITRHYLQVNGRRVHYRKAGSGPPLLLVHQSPRSSAEYEPLMLAWAGHFTCIAPDTPGFGQSDPLPGSPEIGDFADALVELLEALGLARVGAYGFHSGGIILASALRRRPERFAAAALGGYAIWTEAERRIFGALYLPPFHPSGYGEHLTWLWNRILEQSWFFPWFDVRPEMRLPAAHADPARVDAVVQDMLDSGDAYRAGYGAVLRAPRDLPGHGEATCPVLITAYPADPLHAHLARLGELPNHWNAVPVADAGEQQALSLRHLRRYPAPEGSQLPEACDAGFLAVETDSFRGFIHWRRRGPGDCLIVHGPGRSLELTAGDGIHIDLPGHGLSSDWAGEPPAHWQPWDASIRAAASHFGLSEVAYEPAPSGDPERLFPDLTPDRFGSYLTRAWSIVRARHLFAPWYETHAGSAIPFDPAALAPERLAVEHRALLRARAARQYLLARRAAEGGQDGNTRGHAAARAA
jgi:pimeloyl-ACP methyl ester carboxylesterase